MDLTTGNSADSIESVLKRFASREGQTVSIFPDEDLERRIEKEIGDRSDAKASTLPAVEGELIQEFDRLWIAADRRTFARETMIVIDHVSLELKRIRARKFELGFRNVRGHANPENDKIMIGVRYVT